MQMLFLSSADLPQFIREDMESGHWVQEEYSLQCVFPYDPDKLLQRGMRAAFKDNTDHWQVFEIRNIATIEPDHYQQFTAEHIAIAELSDYHIDAQTFTNKTPSQALNTVLSGTGWTRSANNVTATSSGDTSRGNVWQAVQSIANNWNCQIVPRVTISATEGITHRYLDILDPAGTFRGIRLSINKNMPDVTVTYDDTDCYTALYGYGGLVDGDGDEQEELTFADVVWSATSLHPAKPGGQTYLEDPARTALYGRNGQPRFGYYQNGDILDADVLLEKTWEVLNTQCDPKISITGTVADLHRLGYADQPLRINDIAVVEVAPVGLTFYKKIIRLDMDLVDPTSTTVDIGDYIPNIIYINRDTADKASGGGGGGGKGQTNEEKKLYEFNQQLYINTGEIGLRAYQRDLDATDYRVCVSYAAIGCSTDEIENIVAASGALVDENGVLIRDRNGNPLFADGAQPMFSRIIQNADNITSLVTKTGVNSLGQNETLYSKITQNATAISLKVGVGDVATELAVECGNVSISGGNLVVDGYITSAGLITELGTFSGSIYADGYIQTNDYVYAPYVETLSLQLTGSMLEGCALSFLGNSYDIAANDNIDLAHYHAISASESNGVITITQGAAQTTPGTATFNIAATQYYQDAIVAATAAGAASVTLSAGGWTGPSGTNTVTASNGQTVTVSLPSFSTSGGTTFNTSHKTTVYFSTASVTGSLASKEVDASSVYTEGYTQGYADAGGGQGTYSAGWQAALAKVDPPAVISSGTEVTQFTVKVPGATEDTQDTYTFNLTEGTPAASGYVAVSLSGNPVARIQVGDWYTAGVNSVSVTKTWQDNVCTCNPSAGTGLGQTITINATVGTPTSSSPNIYPITITDGSGSGAVTVLSTTVDATARYDAGAASVTLSTPSWNSSSDVSNAYTVTASNGRTRVQTLYVTGGDTFSSSHKTTVYIRSAAVGGTVRLYKEVDASSVYDEGADSVTLSSPTWGSSSDVSNAYTVTASNGKTRVQTLYVNGGTSFDENHVTRVQIRSGALLGTVRLYKDVDATPVYNSVTIDSTTWGGTTTNVNNTITMTASNGNTRSQEVFITGGTGFNSSHTTTVYLRNTSTSGTIRARKTIDATDVYNSGVAAGEAEFTAVKFTYLGTRELGYMDHGNFESVGSHAWYYPDSSGSKTYYTKSS